MDVLWIGQAQNEMKKDGTMSVCIALVPYCLSCFVLRALHAFLYPLVFLSPCIYIVLRDSLICNWDVALSLVLLFWCTSACIYSSLRLQHMLYRVWDGYPTPFISPPLAPYILRG